MFDMLHNRGVSFNATTNKENTYFYFQGLSESLDICLDALKMLVVENRDFDTDVFANELKVVESEAHSFYSSFSQINVRMAQALYGNYGIGRTILGPISNIQTASIEDVSNIDNEAGVYFDGKFAGSNSIASIGFRVPSSDDKIHICTELLSLILSDPIMSERIPVEIRQKRGLAYNVGGFVNQYKNMCTLGIACTCNINNTEEAIRIAMNELCKVKEEGITENELQRAKMNLITKKNVDFADVLRRTICLGKYSSYDRFYSFEDDVRKIRKIDLQYVNEASKQILSQENLGLALIGNVDIEKIVDLLSM